MHRQIPELFEVTVGDRWHPPWALLGTRGLRIGEAMELNWADINFTARSLMIQRALQRHRGAGLRFVDPKSEQSADRNTRRISVRNTTRAPHAANRAAARPRT